MPRQSRPQAYTDRIRNRINSSMVVGKLQGHVEGTVELSATQIQAARILLNKTVPDLASIQVTQGDTSDPHAISAAKLLNVIEGEATLVTDKSLIPKDKVTDST